MARCAGCFLITGPTGPTGASGTPGLHGSDGALAFPVAMIVPTGAAAAADGWLLCDGAEVVGATYPALAVELGTGSGSRFGAAAAGNIRLPDLRQRFPMGKAASGTGSTLGSSGGSKDAAQVSHAHTVNSHSHGGTATTTNHSHTVEHTMSTNPLSGSISFAGGDNAASYATLLVGTAGGSHTHPIPADSPGTNTVGVTGTDANLPAYVVFNYMIKAH